MSRTLHFHDGITGQLLASVPYPTGGRLRISGEGLPEGAQPGAGFPLDSTWLVMDGEKARGLRVSLVGADARNLHVDAEGADLRGAHFLLRKATLATRVEAQGSSGELFVDGSVEGRLSLEMRTPSIGREADASAAE